jgi:hypothetical protein
MDIDYWEKLGCPKEIDFGPLKAAHIIPFDVLIIVNIPIIVDILIVVDTTHRKDSNYERRGEAPPKRTIHGVALTQWLPWGETKYEYLTEDNLGMEDPLLLSISLLWLTSLLLSISLLLSTSLSHPGLNRPSRLIAIRGKF